MTAGPTTLFARATDTWASFAAERRMHLRARPDVLEMGGRYEGIDVLVRAEEDPVLGWTTRVEAEPRLALNGVVTIRPAGRWDVFRALRRGSLVDGRFVARSSSESVARTVVDERVVATVHHLGDRLVELCYAPAAIALVWRPLESDAAILEDAVSCAAYLAAGAAQTPYR